jgi:hypothetical protein
LSKENDFWRSFLVSIMNETLRGSVNPQKILKIFIGRNGGLTERDLNELEEAELSRLMQAKDPAYKAEQA